STASGGQLVRYHAGLVARSDHLTQAVENLAGRMPTPGTLMGVARPLSFPEPFHQGTFRVREARGRVPSGSLRTLANPYRGVRGHDLPDTVAERFAALRLVCPGDLALSHCSAAEVLNLPLPRECEHEALHVTGSGARVRRRGVVAHRGLDRREVTTLRGIPVTGLADTWLDLAPFVSLEDLVVVGD